MPTQPHFRIQHDTVNQFSKRTLCHGSLLHHLGIGRTHTHTPVLMPVTTNIVTIISKTGHHLIASQCINFDHNYWPNQTKFPGRWPGNFVTHDSTHHESGRRGT
ncbi:hypothetical protein JK2ML_0023 [Mycobacterium leprae Kyoto-2]|uniref:Uncharacterized protein n=3 Tax=Mycobacterium leprae TaxID=1769 RepID=Q9CDE3_MYCLE|nr:hypothetical protein DIJ64_00125 [Mycobacterium leprae]BBC16311.1 hypothetical protein JK2ML_0023 [Mycobacterium leprae Kyoto-2]CAC29531.1 hypothetical protein [Mycobacterium leprae]CAR70116.1 hypothetical protein MLBr00023 [Mycobacterium leprae Br4923]